MIPRKLAEIFFSQIWLLLIPILLLPVLVAAVLSNEPQYMSRATVWVASTPSGASTTFGQAVSYLTPAQNQAQVLNDLLATDNFRSNVAMSAGLASEEQSQETRIAIGRKMGVWAGVIGTNVVTVNARSTEPVEAARIVAAVVDEYLTRATEEAQRNADIVGDYYTQQLGIAETELAQRRQALQTYIAEHPEVSNLRSAAAYDLDYLLLRERVDTQQDIVEQLRLSLQETEQELASSPQSQEAAFSLQDPPAVPAAPIPVSLSSRVGPPFAGLFLAVLISTAYLILRYRTDHSIRSAEDLEGLPVPLLGSVREVHPSGVLWRLNPASVFRRRYWRTYAQRSAASIPMIREQP